MAIVQISKLQQRAGNLVDLPQLDNAEFGWATDTNRLFIGRTGNNYTDENIEVLTSYSPISFSQINGSDGGNLNISSALNGQILTYVLSTDTWENYTGTSAQLNGTKLQLGNVANISITGGAIGYVLETDGTGNIGWAPKGTLYSPVIALSNATPIIMTVANTTPYTNGAAVTITNVNGVANANVNGLTLYITLSANFASSGNVELYTDQARTTGANGTGLTYTNSPNAVATSSTSGSGGSGGVGSTANTQIIFNELNLACGSPSLTFNSVSSTLTVGNNVTTANLNASAGVTAARLTSNIATGTAPITVSSTTLVPNLYVARANVSDYAATALTSTGTFYPIFVNATSGNLAQGANANLNFNVATGNLSATLLTGTLTTATQPNITSTGTLTSLTVTGNTSSGNLIGPLANGNSNVSITSNANITLYVAGNTTARLTATTTGLVANGTISVSGNANVGNLGTAQVLATANITTPQFISNVSTGTAPFVVTSTTQVANLNAATTGLATFATTANAVAGANVTGTVANATFATSAGSVAGANVSGTVANATFATSAGSATSIAGANVSGQVANALVASTVYTNAQPNITSVGTLTGLTLANAAIISVGSNTNVGTFTGNFSLSAGSRLNATYADLAEYYEADSEYEAGTVLAFGGNKEVTIAEDETTKVAGVVSTNPAYVMNSACVGEYIVAIALQGRVPCKVRGTILKGDMLVSGGDGYARPTVHPIIGSIIGKALQNFEGEGVIEVAVGRL